MINTMKHSNNLNIKAEAKIKFINPRTINNNPMIFFEEK